MVPRGKRSISGSISNAVLRVINYWKSKFVYHKKLHTSRNNAYICTKQIIHFNKGYICWRYRVSVGAWLRESGTGGGGRLAFLKVNGCKQNIVRSRELKQRNRPWRGSTGDSRLCSTVMFVWIWFFSSEGGCTWKVKKGFYLTDTATKLFWK